MGFLPTNFMSETDESVYALVSFVLCPYFLFFLFTAAFGYRSVWKQNQFYYDTLNSATLSVCPALTIIYILDLFFDVLG